MPTKHQISAKDQKIIAGWLFICAFMVLCMVVIGGLTRLTESGLSITEWQPIKGVLPPLTENDWQEYFDKYTHSPQFKQNSSMNLHEFKEIFWLEYIHRLVGRITGIIFLAPLIFFIIRKKIQNQMLLKLSAIFLLGGLQGVIGWYMVKSGLKDNPYVSPYMLAFHMVTACLIYCLILWMGFSLLKKPTTSKSNTNILKQISYSITFMIFLQIAFGALVAGMHAGLIYNTFPLMNGELLPSDLFYKQPWIINLIANPATVQFCHRILATLLLAAIIGFFLYSNGKNIPTQIKTLIGILVLIITFQYSLGVLTLLHQVPIFLASLHQTIAMILLSFSLYINYGLHCAVSADGREK